MSDLEKVAKVVAEWVAKAENDLQTAAHTLKLKQDCPTDTVCFHVQQCVEKYLKAILVSRSTGFPKTHDLEHLMALLPPGVHIELDADQQRRLTDYATALRYPDYPEVTLAEARKAVALARRVRKEARRFLPRAALRRKRN